MSGEVVFGALKNTRLCMGAVITTYSEERVQ